MNTLEANQSSCPGDYVALLSDVYVQIYKEEFVTHCHEMELIGSSTEEGKKKTPYKTKIIEDNFFRLISTSYFPPLPPPPYLILS